MIARVGAYSATRPVRPPPTLRPMIFVDNGGHTYDRLNLALEKYVLRHKMAGDELLLFYGNAQFTTSDRMFSHGTLLLDSDLDDVTAALRPKAGKIESKGLKSIRSRVANISEFLSTPVTVDELRERILERIFGTRDRTRGMSETLMRRAFLSHFC